MIKKWLYLLENIHKKPLGFGYRHENQTLFFFFEMKIYYWIFGFFMKFCFIS